MFSRLRKILHILLVKSPILFLSRMTSNHEWINLSWLFWGERREEKCSKSPPSALSYHSRERGQRAVIPSGSFTDVVKSLCLPTPSHVLPKFFYLCFSEQAQIWTTSLNFFFPSYLFILFHHFWTLTETQIIICSFDSWECSCIWGMWQWRGVISYL